MLVIRLRGGVGPWAAGVPVRPQVSGGYRRSERPAAEGDSGEELRGLQGLLREVGADGESHASLPRPERPAKHK